MDPGGEAQVILDALNALGVEELDILLTHAHIDHAGGVKELMRLWESKSGTRPQMSAHRAEAEMRSTITQQAAIFGLSSSMFENAPEPDTYIDDGDGVLIATRQGKVLYTPGHAPGHVSVYLESEPLKFGIWDRRAGAVARWIDKEAPLLIAGDTLFAGSIGRTDLPGGNHKTLLDSIRKKIFTLPEETIVLPGHGLDTTVGVEKATNPFFQ